MDRPKRAAALFQHPAERIVSEQNNPDAEAEAEDLPPEPKPRGSKTRATSASSSVHRDIQQQNLEETDRESLSSTSKESASRTARSTKKVAKTNNKEEAVPAPAEAPVKKNQKSSSSMKLGDKMPHYHTDLESKYCAKWVSMKTGGNIKIPIKELDDAPEILFVLAGAAGFPRIRKNLLRFINKNRRIGKKLNELDWSDLPEEVPPFVAPYPILAAEMTVDDPVDNPDGDNNNPDIPPNPEHIAAPSRPPVVKPKTGKGKAASSKPTAKSSSSKKEPSSEASAKQKATKRSAVLDETEEAYMELARENIALQEENETLKMENRALTSIIRKKTSVDVTKLRVPTTALRKDILCESSTSIVSFSLSNNDSPTHINIDSLLERLDATDNLSEDVINDDFNNNNTVDHFGEIPMSEKRRRMSADLPEILSDYRDTSPSVTSNSSCGFPPAEIRFSPAEIRFSPAEISELIADSEEDEDETIKRVPKVALVKQNNNKKTHKMYSSYPVGPMYFCHWGGSNEDQGNGLRLKALYEPFHTKLQEMLEMMLPDEAWLTAETIINMILEEVVESATLDQSITDKSSGSEKPLVIDEGSLSDRSFTPIPLAAEPSPDGSNTVKSSGSLTPKNPVAGGFSNKTPKEDPRKASKAILISPENARMLQILQEEKKKTLKKSKTKESQKKRGSLPSKSSALLPPSIPKSHKRPPARKNISLRKHEEMLGRVRRSQHLKKLREMEEVMKNQEKMNQLHNVFKQQLGDIAKLPRIQKYK